ncbi:hypothetical protein [Labrys neptuniae]
MVVRWLGFLLLVIGRIIEILCSIIVASIAALAVGGSGLVSSNLASAVFRFSESWNQEAFAILEHPLLNFSRLQGVAWQMWLTPAAIWAVPIAGIAIIGELFGLQLWAFYSLGTAAALCGIPFFVGFMPQAPAEFMQLFMGVACTGAIAGFIYWLITGRRAGLIVRSLKQ